MHVGQEVDCLFCLGEGTSRLNLDKRGRPFLKCTCGALTFMGSERCLRGPAYLWGPLLSSISAGKSSAVAREMVAVAREREGKTVVEVEK